MDLSIDNTTIRPGCERIVAPRPHRRVQRGLVSDCLSKIPTMSQLEDAVEADLPAILTLNQSSQPHVSSLTLDALHQLWEWSDYFRVIRDGATLAGFLLALREGLPYASLNYRWFVQRYSKFVYIDRVAIAESHHRRGLGARLYEDLHQFAALRAPVVACEVNTRPVNEVSLAFHQRMGYRPVGSQDTEAGAKTVSLMIRTLS